MIGMRAVGNLALFMSGDTKSKAYRDTSKIILANDLKYFKWRAFKDQALSFPLYTWYYQTQAMFLKGGSSWNRWNEVFKKTITKSQNRKGFWESQATSSNLMQSQWSKKEQRIYATAMCGLMLTVYYRYLPTSEKRKLNQTRSSSELISKQDLKGLVIESTEETES